MVAAAMDELLVKKLSGLLGLGVRGRRVVVGVESVRTAAKRGKLVLAIAACDASANSMNKAIPLLKARGISVLSGPEGKSLGTAVGRETTAIVGIVDRGLAGGIRALKLDALVGQGQGDAG